MSFISDIGGIVGDVLKYVDFQRSPGDTGALPDTANVHFKIPFIDQINQFLGKIGGEATKIGDFISSIGTLLDPPATKGNGGVAPPSRDLLTKVNNAAVASTNTAVAAGGTPGGVDPTGTLPTGDVTDGALGKFGSSLDGLDNQIQGLEGKGDSLSQSDMLKLQDLMNKEQRLYEMLSSMLKNKHDTEMSIIRNIA